MALQDDIFDIEGALVGKPEAEAFYRLQDHINRIEVRNREMYSILTNLQLGMFALKQLEKWNL